MNRRAIDPEALRIAVGAVAVIVVFWIGVVLVAARLIWGWPAW